MNDLQAMDALASEQGLVLGFRLCEDGEEVEPVFMRVEQDPARPGDDVALLAISDRNGFSLGRYVISTDRLVNAIDDAGQRLDAETVMVPADWQRP